MVTETGDILPRWASNDEILQQISRQQKQMIDSDAIFGVIDPRTSNMFDLADMFKIEKPSQQRRFKKERGSSARQWNDKSEFATPNIMAGKEN